MHVTLAVLTCSHAMTSDPDTAKPVTVRLTAKEVKRLDSLAAKSGMTRHRYMSFVLERAMQTGLVVTQRVDFSESASLPKAVSSN
jgi:hypothetical protein